MNISEYLKRKGRDAWVMNDCCFMHWDKTTGTWIVASNPPYTLLNPKWLYHQGESLVEALEMVSSVPNKLEGGK